MSVNKITLKGINKRLSEMGSEPAKLSTVIDLLRQSCENDAVYREEKLKQFNSLLNCAHSNVQDKLRLTQLKETSNEDQELLAMIRQNEQNLDSELADFCQTFNAFCRISGVVQYFSQDDREKIWGEMTEFFYNKEQAN